LDTFLYRELDILSSLPESKLTKDSSYDAVFSVLINGSKKFQPTQIIDLMGVENFTQFSTALSYLFGVLLAQKLNLNNRVVGTPPSTLSFPARTITGTITDPTLIHLQQSLISTRILDAFLGTMFICAALSFYFMKTDKLLPFNPCSVAAGASLLAGSRMLQPESGISPPGAEWCDDKTLKARKVFEGNTFSLKWWRGEEGVQDRFGIDVDFVEEEDDGHV
jgi:hypothetical protein